MAGKSDIQAGGAFVRLFLKDDLSKAIKSAMQHAGKTIHSAGQSIAKAGMAFGAMGGGILSPIIMGVKTFADFGDQLDKMSQRTGVAAGQLAALGFAAEQSGASLDDIEQALRYMQRKGLDPKLFEQYAAEIAAIEDPVARASRALEVFGRRAGPMLLPMLGSISSLTQEARDLGIVPGDEEVAQAAKVTDAINRIRRTVEGLFFAIGSAMADDVLGLLESIKTVTVATGQWVRQNKALITVVAAAGASLLAVGGVLSAAGFAMMGIGSAITFAASAVGVLLSPMGLLTAAVIAGTVAWVKYTDSGKQAWQGLLNAIMPMVETFKTTFGGIADALKAGEIKLAGEILMVGLELVVRQGIERLKSIFGETFGAIANQILEGDLSGAWATVVDSMLVHWQGFKVAVLEVFGDIVIYVSKMWTGLQNKISKWLIDLSQNPTFNAVATAVLGVDMQAEQQRANRLNAALGLKPQNVAEDARAIIDEATRATQEGIERSWASTIEQARQVSRDLQQAQREAQETGSEEAAQRVKELQDRLNALRSQASQTADAAAADKAAAGDATAAVAPSGIGKISGMFRASAIALAGRGASPEQKSLEELKGIRRETTAQRRLAQRQALAAERLNVALTHG
jgi:hypothetical protein